MFVLYNQDISYTNAEYYKDDLKALDKDFRSVKVISDLDRFLDDIESILNYTVQHIWYEKGILEVELEDSYRISVGTIQYKFKSNLLGFSNLP